jgi:glycosyl transferase family 25
MKALVINLDRETARLAFQQDQAARLGYELTRIAAVTVDAIVPPLEAPIWARWQRPLRDVEIATLMSHRIAWERIVAEGCAMLVLEDDAWLMNSAAAFLAQLQAASDVELVTLETRGRRKIMGGRHADLPGLRRLYLDRSGAAAYVLWPDGARKLLARADAVPALADAVLVEAAGLKRWQADPAQAIQIDMADRYGLSAPIAVASAISSVARPGRGGWRFRVRRIYRQAVMGLIGLRTLFGAQRCEVQPAPQHEGR